jgi:transglutaminase-like putative cysteine protease
MQFHVFLVRLLDRTWCAAIATALLLLSGAALAADLGFRIAASPSWVKALPVDYAVKAPVDGGEPLLFLLSDAQTRVHGADLQTYHRFVRKALTHAGVEALARIEVGFDPSYQTLTLHTIRVVRDGQVMERLAAPAVRILQRERELESRIYDGSKTANVFLEDVRVGDIVEFAYTVRGTNPVFGGRLSGWFDLQKRRPVQRLHARLLWPAGRPIYMTPHNLTTQSIVTTTDGLTEYSWDGPAAATPEVDSSAPGWYDPTQWVEWSEFKDWNAVARWAEPLYRVPGALDESLRKEVARISMVAHDDRQQVREVLRFVQGEIRYLGIEIGAGSHAPSAPATVFKRRFGDCKDKSLLMLTLLHALGIEARAALVNTRTTRAVESLQATPNAFNHVLVRVKLGTEYYWLDPTRAPQAGSLERIVQADFGVALVVDSSSSGLTAMRTAAPNRDRRTVGALFDATSDAIEVDYTITTSGEGLAAEDIRSYLSARKREEVQQDYLNYYARYYPSIAAKAPLQVTDDTEANRITVVERYLIREFWQRANGRQRLEAHVYAPDVSDRLQMPKDRKREAPLHVRHPIEFEQTTEVRLPEAWAIKPEKFALNDPVFSFEREISYQKMTLTLVHRYVSRADHVTARDVERYAGELQKARDEIDYVLYRSDPAQRADDPANGINWPVAFIAVLTTGFWLWLARKLHRYDPPPRAAVFDRQLQGIRGWLLLPALGLFIAPFRMAMDAKDLLPPFYAGTWASLTTPGAEAYHPLWAPVLLFEIAINTGSLVMIGLLALLFFTKRTSTPRLYVWIIGGTVLSAVVDIALLTLIPVGREQIDPKLVGGVIRDVVAATVWIVYFRVSVRVSSTFVKRLPGNTNSAEEKSVPEPAVRSHLMESP